MSSTTASRAFVGLLLLSLAACGGQGVDIIPPHQETISTSPGPVAIIPQKGIVSVEDFTNATTTVQTAVAKGVLSKDDPIVGCLADAGAKLGIGQACVPVPATPTTPAVDCPPTSFDATISGISSLGVVIYIKGQQLESALGTIKVSPACKAIIGDVVLKGVNAAKAGASSIPGIGTINSVLPKFQ